MRDVIRRIWQKAEHPLRRLWEWAKAPSGPCGKERRFSALARWARKKREEAKTQKERQEWDERAEAYHSRAVYFRKRCEKKHEAEPPFQGTTGCGGPGAPDWSGGASICEKEVVPVANRFGVPVTSRKRTSTLGNPSSDHYTGNVTAYAVDLGTFSGAQLAHAIANALGISGYSTGNYNAYTIVRCGKRFRVQILWAVSGHFNHVHVGVRAL